MHMIFSHIPPYSEGRDLCPCRRVFLTIQLVRHVKTLFLACYLAQGKLFFNSEGYLCPCVVSYKVYFEMNETYETDPSPLGTTRSLLFPLHFRLSENSLWLYFSKALSLKNTPENIT